MSSTDQIITLFESLSFAEKLSLNERLATAMRKEGGGAAAGKKRGPKAKADGDKPKRKAALGTLAWMAYVKHIKTTKPDALEGLTKEAEKLAIIKGIRAEDPDGYNTFVAAWKEEHKDDASSTSEAASEVEAEAEDEDESASAPPPPAAAAPPKALTAAERIAAMRAAKASAASVASAPSAAKGGAGSAAAAAPKATPAKAKKDEAKAPGAPKKAVKAAAAKKDELKMPVVTIDGADYWHCPESNGLWEKTGDVEDGSGPWIGYWQPEDAENPIRFTENFGDE
jgi:hypothetical protein